MRERLGWKGRDGEGQRRKLGGRCGKCFGQHKTHEFTFHPEELWCRYPPCKNKVGHVTSVCHELTKVCKIPVFQGGQGHRSFCHETIPEEGGKPYGYTEEVAKKLREEFSRFSHLLMDEEEVTDVDELAVMDNSGRSASSPVFKYEFTVFPSALS